MSEIEGAEAPRDAPPDAETADDTGEAPEGSQEPREPREGAGPEAARYRRRLRDTEAERDALRSRVEGLQRREVERLASERLAQGSDVFMFAELGGLLTEEGEVDADAVAERVAQVVADRPGLAKDARTWPDLGQGRREDTASPPATWQGVISER